MGRENCIPSDGAAESEEFRKLLVDNSHEENYDTSGFTQYLVSAGWTIGALAPGPITADALTGYDVLLIPGAYGGGITAFSADEIAAISGWVRRGASAL